MVNDRYDRYFPDKDSKSIFRENTGLSYLAILFFYLYFYDHFADASFAYAGSMAVFREIDGKLSRIDFRVSRRTIHIESNIFFFIIGDRYFLQFATGFPTDLFYSQQRQLYVDILFVCFNGSLFLVLFKESSIIRIRFYKLIR